MMTIDTMIFVTFTVMITIAAVCFASFTFGVIRDAINSNFGKNI